MKYKLVALDLDGTLLNSQIMISEYTSSVLKKIEKMGVKIVIATGRSYSSLKPKIHKLKLEYPVVCYNGAMIRDGKTDEILYNSTLPVDVTKGLIDISRREKMHYQGFLNGEFHFERESRHSEYYRSISGLPGKMINFDDLGEPEFTKTMFIDDPENLAAIEAEVRKKFSDRAYIAYSKPVFLEVMNKTASKSAALDRVVKEYGLTPDDVIAFGDGQNDIDMLSYAGLGLIMKNSSEELKNMFQVTDYTNDEDGVARYLEKIFT